MSFESSKLLIPDSDPNSGPQEAKKNETINRTLQVNCKFLCFDEGNGIFLFS